MPEPRASADPRPAIPPGAVQRTDPTTGEPGATGHASGLRRQILLRLRQDGPSSPDQLAARLGASRTGVLQQLRSLEEAGLVRHERERHGVGRPRHLYDVTPDAQELFPANYDALAGGLLEAIVAVGGAELVDEVFAARRRQLGGWMRAELDVRVGLAASLGDRVTALAELQDGLGYLCEARLGDDGALVMREHNCAILKVARGTRAACDAELQLFSEVLGADVVRETHIASGDRCCSYRISERPS
jgi:predicted ArsR family transcriptional regulator